MNVTKIECKQVNCKAKRQILLGTYAKSYGTK